MLTSTIIMVFPLHFRSNEETASSNTFQKKEEFRVNLLKTVQKEATLSHELLQYRGIDLVIIEDSPSVNTPDSLFPNNWFSTHSELSEKRTIIFYPMMAQNRRKERREEVKTMLIEKGDFEEIIDLSDYENEGLFLEGTGSLVLDRKNKIAFAAISERTNPILLEKWGAITGYKVVSFSTKHPTGVSIYHTNVIMSMGIKTVVVCGDIFEFEAEKNSVYASLQKSGKEIVEISLSQLENFAGNILLVQSKNEGAIWICSTTAYGSLTEMQRQTLRKDGDFQMLPVSTIEQIGGGSARCMVAELF